MPFITTMKTSPKPLFFRIFFCVCAVVATICSTPHIYAKSVAVASPDGRIAAQITDGDGSVMLSITHQGTPLLEPSPISLAIEGMASVPKIGSVKKQKTVTETIDAPLYRQASFSESYNSISVSIGNATTFEVRAYDSGIAYRFATSSTAPLQINSETADLRLPADLNCWLPYSTNDAKPMAMAFQNYYDYTPLSHAKDKLAFLPVTIDYGNGLKLTITESNLESYPGMFVKADTVNLAIKGVFAPYPSKTDFYPWRMQQYVTETEGCIAHVEGTRTYPWRVLAITTDDTQMPVNNLVYALAAPSRIDDTSWIKPGKVAWDWWNDWGLRGVPFKAGINNDSYKYYIDFAATNGIEYVVLDEGWYDPKSGDMLTVIPDLDLEMLVAYGKSKGVDLVLWTVFNVLDTQLRQACEKYSQMGIKGFKVDFLDRDDQTAVEMTYRIAQACADYHLLLDYHGIYKPTGLNRTYPNVINFEAVFGMEETKWTTLDSNMPLYDVTFPYIRLLAGPVDYTPGAMRNASKGDWKAVYSNPISMGTRCHQLATYIVYDSPFTMLADSPSNYKNEDDCVSFIVSVPNTVDETRILAGEIGKYIVTARRSADDWWIGGLTNWDGRDIVLDLSFLPNGKYSATLLHDGVNADKQAQDYAVRQLILDNSSKQNIHMASGGGFALRLTRL